MKRGELAHEVIAHYQVTVTVVKSKSGVSDCHYKPFVGRDSTDLNV